MKQYNGEKYIVSFTTFPARFDKAAKVVFDLLKNQKYKDFHIVCTLYKEDFKKLNGNLKLLFEQDLFEIIEVEENLGPHLKYFYVMDKYWDKPIITVDDDRMNSKNLIYELVKKYESLKYKSIISVSAPCLRKSGNKLLSDGRWVSIETRLKPNQKSYIAMPEGFAGVLYPPECFNNLKDEIKNIKECLYHDDLFLKVLEIKNKVIVTQINGTEKTCPGKNFSSNDKTSLANHNHAGKSYRLRMINKFEKELLKAFQLKDK